MFFYDWTYFLVLLGAVLCMMASAKMRSTYARYSQVRSMSGLTGRETAQRILAANGIYDVTVNRVPGELTDHYDPNKKVVNLSESIKKGNNCCSKTVGSLLSNTNVVLAQIPSKSATATFLRYVLRDPYNTCPFLNIRVNAGPTSSVANLPLL